MKKNPFIGTGVALVTPFDSNGNVDFSSIKKLVDHVIGGGVEYLVALGTTGETATLEKEEKEEVVKAILEAAGGKVPVVRGVGGNNTRAISKELESLNTEGISGILSVSPYYNKPTQEGIFRHYQSISSSTNLPVIVYNVPGRTSSNLSAETTLRLAREVENIVAVKEASGNMEQIMAIIQDAPDGFDVISGDDALTLPILASGGKGVISVVANAFPKSFSEMVRLTMNSQLEEARKLHYNLLKVTGMFFREGNPGGVKAALKHLGVCGEDMRLPLWPISDDLRKLITTETGKIKS